jgi:TPR repeat protein
MPFVVRRPQKAYALVVLVALNLTTDAWADYETGIAAYKRGDYAAAAAEMKILADQNDPRAQTFLGNLYADGVGVPQNWEIAVQLYQKAAIQGHKPAEHILKSLGAVSVSSKPPESGISTFSDSQIFQVQLAAFRSPTRALQAADRLKEGHPELFEGLELRVVRANLGEKLGVWYRIRAGPLPDKASANRLCVEIRQRNAAEGCYLVSRTIE